MERYTNVDVRGHRGNKIAFQVSYYWMMSWTIRRRRLVVEDNRDNQGRRINFLAFWEPIVIKINTRTFMSFNHFKLKPKYPNDFTFLSSSVTGRPSSSHSWLRAQSPLRWSSLSTHSCRSPLGRSSSSPAHRCSQTAPRQLGSSPNRLGRLSSSSSSSVVSS